MEHFVGADIHESAAERDDQAGHESGYDFEKVRYYDHGTNPTICENAIRECNVSGGTVKMMSFPSCQPGLGLCKHD